MKKLASDIEDLLNKIRKLKKELKKVEDKIKKLKKNMDKLKEKIEKIIKKLKLDPDNKKLQALLEALEKKLDLL